MRTRSVTYRMLALAGSFALCSATVAGQGVTQPKQGKGGSVVQGSAGTSGSSGAKGLEHCDKPMGAMAVVEPQDYVIQALWRYQLQSPSGLIRMMIQQSNCFVVVERGAGMQNMMQERQLSNSGQLRQDSNVGGGQMVAADFLLTPAVVFSENNAAGVGAGVAGMFGSAGRAVGSVAGGLRFKEAQTSMLVSDSRSGVQVAAAEGSTRKADLNLGGALFGYGGGGSVGGYGNTNEGKIIAAALLDNYNQIVTVVRGDPTLQRSVGSLREEAAAGGKTVAGAVFEEGDVLIPKIGKVAILAAPQDGAKVVGNLVRGDEVVVVGKQENGYVNVQGTTVSGWVRVVLVQRP